MNLRYLWIPLCVALGSFGCAAPASGNSPGVAVTSVAKLPLPMEMPTEEPTPSPLPTTATLTPPAETSRAPTATRSGRPRPSATPPFIACTRSTCDAIDGIFLGSDLAPDERRMLADGLQHLKGCAPPLYVYVRTHVREVHRGQALQGSTAYVFRNLPVVFLPEAGAVNNPARYIDSMRTFMSAALLVHEARHIEMGAKTTEPDAYAFELQVFTPSCKPNDIGDAPTSQYERMRRYVVWRASLPYAGEPPANVIPQEFQR